MYSLSLSYKKQSYISKPRPLLFLVCGLAEPSAAISIETSRRENRLFACNTSWERLRVGTTRNTSVAQLSHPGPHDPRLRKVRVYDNCDSKGLFESALYEQLEWPVDEWGTRYNCEYYQGVGFLVSWGGMHRYNST